MDKQTLLFTANEQTLTKTAGSDNCAANTVSYIEAQFTLGDNWTGFDSIRAVWKSQYYTISAVVDANGKCSVPAEVMYYKSKVYVNLVGSTVDGDVVTDRLTTYPLLAFTVDAETEVDGQEGAEITPSQFDQFVAQVEGYAEAAAESADEAEASAESVSASAAQIATNTADISQLKEDLTDLDESLTTGIHPIDPELTTSPSTRFVSKKLYLNAVTLPVSFNCSNNSYSYYIGYYKSDDTFISTTAWQKGTYTVTTANIPAETAYFIMTCKADDEHSLSEAEKDYYSCWNEYVFYTDIAELKKILSTAFVDGTNGSDGNNGLSMNAPFKTITKAINSGARIIRCAKGTYSERLALTNVNDLTIMPYNYGTFDGTSYADKITLDGINTRPYLLTMSNCSNITLIGLETINFTNSGIKAENCSNIKLINCSSGNQYGSYQYGIAFELINTDADFDTCISHDVLLDGFNIHGYGVTAFRNCIAYNCGDDGISHHDACVGYITGGEYYNCGKGGIASPTYGSYIDISGAYCHDNKYGIYAVSSSARRKSKTNISNCASANNNTADIYIDYADAVGWNNQYTTKTVGTNGSFTEI